MFKPIKEKKLYLQVVDQVKLLIDEGQLKPGDVLPTVDELSHNIGVSKTTVREALVVLETIGCIDTIRGKGSIIKSKQVQQEQANDPAAMLRKYKNTFEALQEFDAIYEPAIAKIAAEKATDEDIAELEEILEENRKLIKKKNGYKLAAENSMTFHHKLIEMTHNPFFMNLYEFTREVEKENRKIIVRVPKRVEGSYNEHMRVLDAIRDRDGERAYAEMLKHVLEVGDTFTNVV